MKLSVDTIRKITTGAVRVEEENGLIHLYRFTKQQQELYKKTSEDFYAKSLSAAGIKMLFKTDSENLVMKFETGKGSSRSYFSVDVSVNGEIVGYIDNFSERDLSGNYTADKFPLGEMSGNVQLGVGEKEVCVYLPWSVSVAIHEILLDDGAYIEQIKPEKKLLAFGDSITQGYDALRPSNRYISKLSEQLGAEEYNKAIGGEIFFPSLAECKDDFIPDYITVAYGTNDWNRVTEETFRKNCLGFFTNLRQNYPDTPIIAITPIWRKEMDEQRQFGQFRNVDKAIREITENIENIIVIDGFGFVPQDEMYFADLSLHPNDKGFEAYFKSLYNELLLNRKDLKL